MKSATRKEELCHVRRQDGWLQGNHTDTTSGPQPFGGSLTHWFSTEDKHRKTRRLSHSFSPLFISLLFIDSPGVPSTNPISRHHFLFFFFSFLPHFLTITMTNQVSYDHINKSGVATKTQICLLSEFYVWNIFSILSGLFFHYAWASSVRDSHSKPVNENKIISES